MRYLEASPSTAQRFVASALAPEGAFVATADLPGWLARRQGANTFDVNRIPFAELDRWGFDPDTGNLVHDTGRFFSVEGIRVRTDYGAVPEWTQPIMYQPEIGLLGLVVKEFDGILHFLVQAKMEPGNTPLMQFGPTLQATRSNYTGVHQGNRTKYLEYFTGESRGRVLVDVLQSEQGDSFYRKRNRNMIVEVTEEVPLHDDFSWMTLGQINTMLRKDNLVNMDIRTVLACAPLVTSADPFATAPTSDSFRAALRTSLSSHKGINPTDAVLSWFTDMKTRYQMVTDKIPLNQVRQWEVTDKEIRHVDGKFLSVVAVSVKAGSREVAQWTQPLFSAQQEGLAALLVKPFEGVLHALVQGKLQPGHSDLMEIAPTVQCVTGGYRDIPVERIPPFLDYVMAVPEEQIRYDALLCEEGGRFYQRENRYMVIEVDDDFPAEAPPNYTWVSLRQIKQLIKYSNIFDMEARTLLCCLQSLC